MAYQELRQGPVAASEAKTVAYWNEIDLLHKSVESREGKESFVFFEGPPTANGRPGIHHVLARALKDAVCRFKTMEGYQVKRKAGWDTHGLPVEIEVEKRIGLADKQAIESYGIDKFNKACRDSVFEYEGLWRDMTEQMAYLVDLDNPYITLDNQYIESVWWILNKFFKEDYIYEGHKILPYCPRCGTGLASHEVAQGYIEKKTNTVVVKFKVVDKDEYFLVWTTTPWTLAANVALTVNPNETYLKVKFEDTVYYVEKTLSSKVIDGDFEVLETLKGSDLEHIRYEQIMPFATPDKDCFYVTCGDYVTTEDGTGIVHTAPAFGEDDYNLGLKYGLPVLQPVNEEGKYTTTPWEGKFVMDPEVDVDIIKWLAVEGKLFSKQRIDHNYPHCWRCKTPLLYYAKPSWYIEMTRLKDQLIENNNSVNWYPSYVGEKRFGNWLENLNDWAISRSRYWGTPLNIWRCECGELDSVGSIQELKDRAIEEISLDIDLHRPEVDNVHLKCEKCSGSMTRVPDVIDCWFDSGAMPFAQHHYPFENKENFDELYPADFICEGIDQTRGWFYSLIAISTFVMGKSPYKNVLVNDMVLDKYGKKMSKSKGNGVDAFELLSKYGADATRWYMYYVSPAWQPTKFDEDGLKDISSKFFGTLKNSYTFFTLYANTDGLDVKAFDVPVGERPEIDRWLLSKLNKVVKAVNEDLAIFDLTKAVRKIQEFVVEDLSNWYIRRSRRRFWATELTDDKKSVYKTTYEVLETVSRLIAPFAPFISEEIYSNLVGGESVHLAEYPKADLSLISEATESRMDLVRELVGLGRAAREAVKIKVRQPIAKVMVDGAHEALISDLVDLIKEELNVKEVVFEDNLATYMDFTLKPNFKVCGPLLGKNMGAFNKALSGLDASVWAPKMQAGESIELDIAGEAFTCSAEHVDVRIAAKDGFTVEMANNLFMILDTTLTEDLITEGFAREFVSRIQQMRKSNGFEVADNIKIHYNSTQVFESAVSEFAEYIKGETLTVSLENTTEGEFETFELNGEETNIRVMKA
ncbi:MULTISPECIES: isoleucine--tRNA ligase [unclassified Fusibacter]|uniref:isoleucine--tRNA ligase n=1 Tax=unclassified Fusibacter TaxID=2624464 RepID=UPI0010133E23|nr:MULTISPECIES: isoleucine--tRNA ligase [unclassified Fusibacter]MCK8058031.1 isoleucine--tRNA ligase [Fusibacter sp. A2]NPE20613.1 isoleucine--tRNA ligase [Fusibacter sp. A1]RXV62820.1 isoleucine--tRNA ligase [Fusibacter sp. A1]